MGGMFSGCVLSVAASSGLGTMRSLSGIKHLLGHDTALWGLLGRREAGSLTLVICSGARSTSGVWRSGGPDRA